MSQILLITSSPRGTTSYSSRLARSLAEKLAAGEAHSRITVRDLKAALGFIGLTDIEVIAIEGVAFGPAAAEKAMANASARVTALAGAVTTQNILAA